MKKVFYLDGITCKMNENDEVFYTKTINGKDVEFKFNIKDTPRDQFEYTVKENEKVYRILEGLRGNYVKVTKGFRATKEIYTLQPTIEGYLGQLVSINNYTPNDIIHATYPTKEKLSAFVGDEMQVGATQILQSMVLDITVCDENGYELESVYSYN